MLNTIGTIGAVGSGSVAAYLLYSRTRGIGTLEDVRTIDDVVALLSDKASQTTDDLLTQVYQYTMDHGISENCVQIISRLHMQYGLDLGIHGYAINTVWAGVTDAIRNGALICVNMENKIDILREQVLEKLKLLS